MLKGFIKNLDRKKLKVFLVFLVFSFLSWSISKLSQTYESWVEVNLVGTKIPDSLLIRVSEGQKAKIKLRASGFKLLGMEMGSKSQKIDLSSVSRRNQQFFITSREFQNQLDRRLSNTEILGIQPDSLFFDLYQVESKKVRVKTELGLELAQNYILDGELNADPDSVWVKGPPSELKKIKFIKTIDFTLKDVSDDFKQELILVKPESVTDCKIDVDKIIVSGKIMKFSEKIFNLPIDVENAPENYEVRIFPNTVGLLCKAGEEDLRTFSEESFQVVAVYDSVKVNQKTISLQVSLIPETAISVRLLEDEVKFVLEPK